MLFMAYVHGRCVKFKAELYAAIIYDLWWLGNLYIGIHHLQAPKACVISFTQRLGVSLRFPPIHDGRKLSTLNLAITLSPPFLLFSS